MGSRQVKDIKKLAMKEVGAEMNARLDSIEKFVKENIGKMDSRSQNMERYLVREINFNIANKIYNLDVTIDSFMEVLKDEGVTIPDFAAKLDAKKLEVDARKKAEAEAKMKEQMEARQALVDAAKARQEQAAEQPAPAPSEEQAAT
jgi:hypothetical protein